MEKATLTANETGARLSIKRDVICLEQQQGTYRVGIEALKQIVIENDVWLSSQFIQYVLAAGVSLVMTPKRRQQPAQHLLPQPDGALATRLRQYAVYLNPQQRLAIAKHFVIAKINTQEQCLNAHGINLKMQQFINSAQYSDSTAALMGAEGAATARYFQHWGQRFDAQWKFSGRNRRPPRDPVNALLSLGYMLTCHTVGRLAAHAGFETALGFLHAPASGRQSLALDLVEPLRPWVDEWVHALCHSGDLSPNDFTYPKGAGCRLSQPAARGFFHHWYTRAEPWFEYQTREQIDQLKNLLQCE